MNRLVFIVSCVLLLALTDFDLARAQDSSELIEKYLPEDGGVVYQVDAREILKRKEYLPLIDLLDQGGLKYRTGLSMADIALFAGATENFDQNVETRWILWTNKDVDALTLMRMNRWVGPKDVPDTQEYGDKSYYAFDRRGETFGLFQPRPNVIVVNSAEKIEEMLRGRRVKKNILRSKEWKELSGYQFRFAVGKELLATSRKDYQRYKDQTGGPTDPMMKLLEPIYLKVEQVMGGVRVDSSVALRISLFAENSTAAKDIVTSLETLLGIGKSVLPSFRQATLTDARGEAQRQLLTESWKVADALIASLKFQRIGREVRLTTSANLGNFVETGLPKLVSAARVSARRTQSANNLKQIALAMHNFHDTHKKFPPAVVVGPKGHKHSWRIQMLPFLGELELYNSYRLDEPWDSPNNTAVMKKMPEVFRHPNDQRGSVNTRYLAFVGPGSPWENPAGFSFGDLSDGSSNTIMLFSGESNVPWTKPEDIAYDPTKEVRLGELPFKEGFQVSLFDGSVQFFPSDIDPEQLHRLIQSADGLLIDRQ